VAAQCEGQLDPTAVHKITSPHEGTHCTLEVSLTHLLLTSTLKFTHSGLSQLTPNSPRVLKVLGAH
jgi:hypothetical protein